MRAMIYNKWFIPGVWVCKEKVCEVSRTFSSIFLQDLLCTQTWRKLVLEWCICNCTHQVSTLISLLFLSFLLSLLPQFLSRHTHTPPHTHSHFLSPLAGHFVVIETVTPIGPMKQKVTHSMYSRDTFFNRLVSKVNVVWLTTLSERVSARKVKDVGMSGIYVCTNFLYYLCSLCSFLWQIILTGLVAQFSKDNIIWDNKMYNSRPVLVKTDGNIAGFRRWYSKFYPKKPQQCAQSLDW